MKQQEAMFVVTPIQNEVRIHTGIDAKVKKQIEALSARTQVPQMVIINSLLSQALRKKK